ncbi:hypothetical protein [Aquimarina sp. U1-2]
MISLLYSSGLRRGELLDVQYTYIDKKSMLITVRQTKENRDR